MSGDSSNASGGFSESERFSESEIVLPARGRRIYGITKRCWCGVRTIGLNSKSDNNPNRRYFRCAYAVSEKVWGDDHVFKWVDEGLVEEVEAMKVRNRVIEEEIKAMKLELMEVRNVMGRLDSEVMRKVENALAEAQYGVMKTVVVVFVGLVLGVCCTKVF